MKIVKPTPLDLTEINNTKNTKNTNEDRGDNVGYYRLPPGPTSLQHLISYKNMNSQMGEMFRSIYRYGECPHSDRFRELNKIIYYANAELERLIKYGTEEVIVE